jgi:hypothetical protein
MKRTMFSLLVAGLFGGVGTAAIAQNVTAENQLAAEADSTTEQNAMSAGQTIAENANADRSTLNADYKTAQAKAQAEYEMAKAKCEPLQGNPMRSCMTDARTARAEALALAETRWDDQGETSGTDAAKPARGSMK